MTVLDTPARTDLATPIAPAATDAATAQHPFRLHGTVLTIGAAMWSASIALFGTDPVDSAVGAAGFAIGSGTFQVGLLLLLRVLWRTGALGTGRVAKTFLVLVNVFVGLALASTIVDGFRVSDLSQTGWLILDLFWPVSMMSMFCIAIRIAIAGRWKGVARFWPLVAESWAVCAIPAMNLFGADVARVVGSLHLLVGYCVLGVIVARKQH